MCSIIAEKNITKATIFRVAIRSTTITISHRETSVIFVTKKIITLISIQIMSNKKQKNIGDETEIFVKIISNITHVWLIINRISMITIVISIKKQII